MWLVVEVVTINAGVDVASNRVMIFYDRNSFEVIHWKEYVTDQPLSGSYQRNGLATEVGRLSCMWDGTSRTLHVATCVCMNPGLSWHRGCGTRPPSAYRFRYTRSACALSVQDRTADYRTITRCVPSTAPPVRRTVYRPGA